MYAQQRTWLPSAQRMGLGAISFDDLHRAARRSRGMGQYSYPTNGIAPGSPCYDPSHDAGINHCMPFEDVFLSAFGAAPKGTTTCSDGEVNCMFPSAVVTPPGPPGLPTGYDPTTGLIIGNPSGTVQPGTPAQIGCPAGSVMSVSGQCVSTSVAGQNGTPSADWCLQNIGLTCPTLGLIGAGVAVLLLLASALGGKR